MRAPEFWSQDTGLAQAAALALSPFGALYGLAGRIRRWTTAPTRLPIPVICVGNVTAGGTGKTPTALAIAALLTNQGAAPWFLTRGYGGRESGPLIVDPARHDAAAVGDEALLLAAAHPTILARNRRAGGDLAVRSGAELLIMDDGFQNPALAKDFSILVFDGGAGLGNGRLLPAGPLRETLANASARADLVLIIGADRTGLRDRLPAGSPVMTGDLTPNPSDAAALAGRRLVAFAGIGRPEKFFESLRAIGADLRATHAFGDHHVYSASEIAELRVVAAREQADLATTAKDFIRLAPADRRGVAVLRVDLTFDAPEAMTAALQRVRR